MPNILVIGSVNMDVVARAPRAAAAGETLTAESVSLVPGGKGANAAVAAARLGGTARFVGAVGDDAFGPRLRRGLEDDGVDTRWLATVPGPSGAAVIIVDSATGQNRILVGPGANHAFDLPPGDEPFRWADLVVMPLEIPLSAVMDAARRARAAGKPLLLDPAPAPERLPDELCALVDWLSPNESELARLAGLPGLDNLPAAAYHAGLPAAVAEAAGVLRRRGCRAVVAKLGAHGACWLDGTREIYAPVPRPVAAIDTTAAGDAFTGALAVALAGGAAPPAALELALAAGSLACTARGAQPSLPRRAAVEDWLRGNPARG